MLSYSKFPLIEETNTDGWIYGAITEFIDSEGCKEGDGYVQAPDGSRACLVWDVGDGELQIISGPDKERWGIYQVYFPKKVYTLEDLIDNFQYVLPAIRNEYERLSS